MMGINLPTVTPKDPMYTDQSLERNIDGRRQTWEGWLARVIANGPNDTEGAAELLAASTRYQLLVQLRRSYGETDYEEKAHHVSD